MYSVVTASEVLSLSLSAALSLSVFMQLVAIPTTPTAEGTRVMSTPIHQCMGSGGDLT